MKTFVEIGSCDFGTLNHLYYDGWRGVIVEPVKRYLDRLEQHPSIDYVNAAIDTKNGHRDLWICPDEYHEISNDYKGMSSFYRDSMQITSENAFTSEYQDVNTSQNRKHGYTTLIQMDSPK